MPSNCKQCIEAQMQGFTSTQIQGTDSSARKCKGLTQQHANTKEWLINTQFQGNDSGACKYKGVTDQHANTKECLITTQIEGIDEARKWQANSSLSSGPGLLWRLRRCRLDRRRSRRTWWQRRRLRLERSLPKLHDWVGKHLGLRERWRAQLCCPCPLNPLCCVVGRPLHL